MNRHAQTAVLFLLGAALLRTGFTDQYLRYVKAGLRPLLIVAGAVLVAAAVATLWYELRRSRPDPGGRERGGHREPAVSWLMVLPLLALVLVAPPALGSYSATRTGTALQKPWGFPALPAHGPLRLGVLDYAGRAAYDHGRGLDDRRITLTGFVTLDREGRPYLTRMVLNCCAADGQPVKVGLSGRTPPVLQPDTWLEVSGSYTDRRTKDPVGGGVIPYFDIDRARPVPEPSDPYESWGG
ncbi:TIGR03943 family protein [Streptomyces sp. NPDC047108]|uniref:TIGR03943 family putative permease subunit n=1 Tax=Streptomyces sp. NPDC047108 TaxID=3155025 RepID=UPI0033F076A0